MPSVTYIQEDGTTNTVDVPAGISLMEGSIRNNLPGIIAECGGNCSCGTCHVYVEGEWLDRLEEPDISETELVEFMENRRENSRLSCQVLMADDLDGIVLQVAANEL
jgi:2Fe-2S ferredoxin